MDLALRIVTTGRAQDRLVPLPVGARLRVGRSVDTDVLLTSLAISRLHCEVWRDEAGVWLRDAQSPSGTWVRRGRACAPEHVRQMTPLHPCDVFRAGPEEVRLVLSGPADPAWLRRNEGAVRTVARGIMARGDAVDDSLVEGFLMLLDALLEAGCDDVECLQHCRTPCRHRAQCSLLHLLSGGQA